jgi:hypothetical protein
MKVVGLVEGWRSQESLGKRQHPVKEKSEDLKAAGIHCGKR